MKYIPKFQRGAVVTNDPNDPKLKAYQDSSLIYNTDQRLKNNLIKAGYIEEESQRNLISEKNKESAWERKMDYQNIMNNSGKALPNYIKSVSGRDDLFKVMDYYPGPTFDIPGDDFQYFSPNIAPQGRRVFTKTEINPTVYNYDTWESDKLKFPKNILPIMDMRIVNDFSNVKPKQEVKYVEPNAERSVKTLTLIPRNVTYPKRDIPISRINPIGMPNSPKLIPNSRILPDVVYKDNNVPNAAYNQGVDITHFTDSLGRWAAKINMSTVPGVRGSLYTPNPLGNYTIK